MTMEPFGPAHHGRTGSIAMNDLSRRRVMAASLGAGALASRLIGHGDAAAGTPSAGAKPDAKRDWWDKEFHTLVTLGESTTAGGWASCRERAWASQLARLINEFQRVPVQLVNVGIGANVISTRSPRYEQSGKPAALERLDRHVIRHRPDLLVVSYGFNDARSGTPLPLFAGELRALIRQVREHIRPLIVLLGPYYMTAFEEYGPKWNHATPEMFHEFNRAIGEIAAETECLYVDLLPVYANAGWLIHRDGVHAHDLGHRLVANKIFEILASNCSGLARETKELEAQIPPWRDESVLKRGDG
jgi:lysophospholipase L1-like esterase